MPFEPDIPKDQHVQQQLDVRPKQSATSQRPPRLEQEPVTSDQRVISNTGVVGEWWLSPVSQGDYEVPPPPPMLTSSRNHLTQWQERHIFEDEWSYSTALF